MKNCTEHVGTLEIVKRLPSSTNGNSRFLIRVDGFTCRTAPDSDLADYVKAYKDKTVRVEICSYYGQATLRRIAIENS